MPMRATRLSRAAAAAGRCRRSIFVQQSRAAPVQRGVEGRHRSERHPLAGPRRHLAEGASRATGSTAQMNARARIRSALSLGSTASLMLAAMGFTSAAAQNAAAIARGQEAFTRQCAPCHGSERGDFGRAMLPGTDALRIKYKGAVPALLTERKTLRRPSSDLRGKGTFSMRRSGRASSATRRSTRSVRTSRSPLGLTLCVPARWLQRVHPQIGSGGSRYTPAASPNRYLRGPRTAQPLTDEDPRELQPLIDAHHRSVVRRLRSGNEPQSSSSTAMATSGCAKVYKDAQHRGFHNLASYRSRKQRGGRDERALRSGGKHGRNCRSAWKNAEVDALYALDRAGVRVPNRMACSTACCSWNWLPTRGDIRHPD